MKPHFTPKPNPDCNRTGAHTYCENGYQDCKFCGAYISWEHGGEDCDKCDAWTCCDKECIEGHKKECPGQGSDS